ncbi:MAG: hypothetical protein EBW87_04320 [Burkholderiaceae bacterium]|nr:hypothetical protein [Burkholderiaceae bacterium]
MILTRQQLEILRHTIGADEYGRRVVDRNHFVTDPDSHDGLVCESLVVLALMNNLCPQGEMTGGMALYRATDAGFRAVYEFSPKPPKMTSSQRRYQRFLAADSGLTFLEWLKTGRHKVAP